MTDHWMPLAEDNPIPGDPWALQNLATHLRERGAVIRDVLDDLKKIDSTGYWESAAAEGFTEQRNELTPNLNLLAARYEKTSTALCKYCRALDDAQDKAEAARQKAKAAQAALVKAQCELDSKAAEALKLPADPLAVPVFRAPDPSQVALEHAEGELTIARTLLEEAERLRDEAAGTCATDIDDAIHDELKNEGGFWSGVQRFAKDIVDNFPYVDDIARIAGLASGVLGLLSLIPPLTPFLAPAAAIAGGVSLLANSTLAAAGEQSWGPAMLDAAGVLTFGLGRVAIASSRAAAGAELLDEAARLKAFRLANPNFSPFSRLTPLGTVKVHTTGRHIKQTTGLFGRAALPFLDAAGRPMGNWAIARSSAAFWRHAELPGKAVLAVTPRAASISRFARASIPMGAFFDSLDIYNDPGVQGRVSGQGDDSTADRAGSTS